MPPKRQLSLFDYASKAEILKVRPDALRAVGKVESKGEGFDASGFPTILFERHKFYKNADRKMRDAWHRQYPSLCNPKTTPRGGYGTKADQRVKFSAAMRLDPDAAMMACSWGTFQELGENYDDYGFANVGEFVDMMKSGVDGHLEIFVRSIRHRGLIDELQRLDWAGFARNYNGSGYRTFEYDTKMSDAYKASVRENIDWKAVLAAGSTNVLSLHSVTDTDIDDLLSQLSTVEQDPAGSQAALPEEPAPTVGIPETEAGLLLPPDPAETVEKTETRIDSPAGDTTIHQETTPPGDAPNVAPSHFLSLEDIKPFVKKWLSRIWTGNFTANFAQATGLITQSFRDPQNWYIYLGIAAALFVVFGIGAVMVSAVLLIMWWRNRGELERGKMFAAQTLIDPNLKNLGITIEKKGEK